MTTTIHPLTCSALEQKQEGYQGFKNYPTWAVHLWIGEETYWQARIADSILAGRTLEYASQISHLADIIKDIISEDLYGVEGEGSAPQVGLAADLFNYAIGEVDWREIATIWHGYDVEDLKAMAEDL